MLYNCSKIFIQLQLFVKKSLFVKPLSKIYVYIMLRCNRKDKTKEDKKYFS